MAEQKKEQEIEKAQAMAYRAIRNLELAQAQVREANQRVRELEEAQNG